MLFLHLGIPTHLPHPTFTAHTEPISQGHCWKWHHKLFDTYNVCYIWHLKLHDEFRRHWRFELMIYNGMRWGPGFWSSSLSCICLGTTYLVFFLTCLVCWLTMGSECGWGFKFSVNQKASKLKFSACLRAFSSRWSSFDANCVETWLDFTHLSIHMVGRSPYRNILP